VSLTHNAVVLSGGVYTIKPVFVYGNQLQYSWTPATYLSSDTSASPVSMPDDDITYRLLLTAEGGCTATDTIFIKVLKGPEVPNAFSPNGDGINDTWRIKNLESYPGASVEVYDRSGQIVFRATGGYMVEWNGTHNGKPLPVGTYYYIINPKNGRQLIAGSVTIIK
jgi:gliding motility-associated-like protein